MTIKYNGAKSISHQQWLLTARLRSIVLAVIYHAVIESGGLKMIIDVARLGHEAASASSLLKRAPASCNACRSQYIINEVHVLMLHYRHHNMASRLVSIGAELGISAALEMRKWLPSYYREERRRYSYRPQLIIINH